MPEDNEMEYGPDILTLVDEDGEEKEFEVVDVLDKDGEVYYALTPVVTSENLELDDGDLIILKVTDEDGEEVLCSVDDDDEYDDVVDIFMDRLSDMYDFDVEDGPQE